MCASRCRPSSRNWPASAASGCPSGRPSGRASRRDAPGLLSARPRRLPRDLRPEEALDHVFGYTVVNDVTARDLPQRRPQWFRDKSLALTLRPGDVIATGIPEGVGVASGRFLRPGGRVEAEVERIGVLAIPVVAP